MTTYDDLVDLALGSRCAACSRAGRPLCRDCAATLPGHVAVRWPDPAPPGLALPWSGGAYAGGLRALLIDHKEHARHALRRPLASLLAAAIAHAVAADPPVVLVPVPSRPGVSRGRGYDPTGALVAAAAADLRRAGVRTTVHDLLRSAGGVRDQAGLSALERWRNLEGSLACPSSGLRRLRRTHDRVQIVVCDDVLTTGATAREAQRALESVGLVVTAIAVVAATPRRPRAGE